MFETFILPAIGLGLSAVSIPGPLQAYLLNTTLRFGWRRGMLVVPAPLIVDGPIILIEVFLLGQMPDWVIQMIRVIGGLLLLWIAWGAWKQLRIGASFTADIADSDIMPAISARRVLGTAIAMNIFSPGPYLFWATVTGPLLLQALEVGSGSVAGMMIGFYGTFLGGLALLVIVVNRLGKIGPEVTRYLLLLTIVLLVWFSSSLLAEAFSLTALHSILTWIALCVGVVYIVYQMRRRVYSH